MVQSTSTWKYESNENIVEKPVGTFSKLEVTSLDFACSTLAGDHMVSSTRRSNACGCKFHSPTLQVKKQ